MRWAQKPVARTRVMPWSQWGEESAVMHDGKPHLSLHLLTRFHFFQMVHPTGCPLSLPEPVSQAWINLRPSTARSTKHNTGLQCGVCMSSLRPCGFPPVLRLPPTFQRHVSGVRFTAHSKLPIGMNVSVCLSMSERQTTFTQCQMG